MNYRLRDNSQKIPGKRPTKRYALIALSLVLIAVFFRTAVPDFTTRVFLTAAAPFWKGGSSASRLAQTGEGVVKSKGVLIQENKVLEEEIRDLELHIAGFRDLESENAELRAMLGLSAEERFAVAAVLSTPPRSPYDSLVLEVGDGVEVSPGVPIYAGSSILIGEVAEVHGRQVVGKLYSSAGTEFTAVVERTNVPYTVTGTGGGNFEIKIPRDADIVEGDRLLKPGLVPKIVGEVREIEVYPTDSFKKALIRSPVNIFQLEWVTIGQHKLQ